MVPAVQWVTDRGIVLILFNIRASLIGTFLTLLILKSEKKKTKQNIKVMIFTGYNFRRLKLRSRFRFFF